MRRPLSIICLVLAVFMFIAVLRLIAPWLRGEMPSIGLPGGIVAATGGLIVALIALGVGLVLIAAVLRGSNTSGDSDS